MSSEVAALDAADVAAQRAWKVRSLVDVTFPVLKYWNYDACRRHIDVGPQVSCEYKECGGDLFRHQRVGITWLYLIRRGILADVTGAGKSNHVLGMAALMKERGELTGRMVVVCRPAAVRQWQTEAGRWTPRLWVETATGTRSQRIQKYVGNWDILVIGYQMLLRDLEMLARLGPTTVVSDDVDPVRNPDTATFKAVSRLTRDASRVVMINATPLQIRLQEMWATAVPVGGKEVFGNLAAFERRYVRQEPVTIWNTRLGKKITKMQTTGYKNFSEYKTKIAPLYLRRNYDQLTDIRMPAIMPPETVWLDLHPAQRKKYDELQKGVLVLLREEGEKVKQTTALTKVGYGQQICAGLPALGEADGPEASSKLDWLMDRLTGDWVDQKAVVYVKNVGMVAALEARCAEAGIGAAKVWGKETGEARQAEIDRFWKDPNCRVCVGTSAMEMSINLHNANIIVNLDTLLNPQRMVQILGRIRRAGSRHSHVFVFNLMCRDTQEERYDAVLSSRAALADAMWGEENEVFGKLSPLQLLELIKP